jgi:hypothetical protein
MWHLLTLTLYSVVVAGLALWVALPTAFVLFLLCGVPLAVLMYERPLQLGRLLVATALVAVVFVVIDAVAHTTGAWYSIVQSSTRLLGVSFESVLFAFVHSLYFLVLYEFFFDDGVIQSRRQKILLPLMVTLGALVVSFFYLFSVELVSFSFLWILAVLFLVLIVTLLFMARGASGKILEKVFWFAVAVWPLSVLMELVALANGVRVFAFTTEYMATVTLFGQVVPLEELVLLLVWPMTLAALYECYLDDTA